MADTNGQELGTDAPEHSAGPDALLGTEAAPAAPVHERPSASWGTWGSAVSEAMRGFSERVEQSTSSKQHFTLGPTDAEQASKSSKSVCVEPTALARFTEKFHRQRHSLETQFCNAFGVAPRPLSARDQDFRPPDRTLASEDADARSSRSAPPHSSTIHSGPSAFLLEEPPDTAEERNAASASWTAVFQRDNATAKAFGAMTRGIMQSRRNMKELRSKTQEALSAVDEKLNISETANDLDHKILDGAYSRAMQKWNEKRNQRQSNNPLWTQFNKLVVRAGSKMGSPRPLVRAVNPDTLCFYDANLLPGVTGCVALTIDDAPCSQHDPGKCMLREVQQLLQEFNAKATFFLCTDYVPFHEDALHAILKEGHEIGNHCGADRSYSADPLPRFEEALLDSECICNSIRGACPQPADTSEAEDLSGRAAKTCGSMETMDESSSTKDPVHTEADTSFAEEAVNCGAKNAGANMVLPKRPARWFRAPHADASVGMMQVLEKHGFTNVLCDCFANDTNISDPAFIADSLLSLLDAAGGSVGGSIIVVHMPERGFREYNLQTLRLLLCGLRDRHLRVLTVTGLNDAAWQGGVRGNTSGDHDSAAAVPPAQEETTLAAIQY